ncbi:medium-chain acyl-CoA ligase ACSF2, mitochondrial-like [Hyalella azteca]|uniref:Medium-chain acyl-CoA ligase ACSF2, mitochondrial n=1 Tax=Hyalella azteca TaxID=294128 RepID=A0A8B7N6M1_HYAAZ|nr:medium-chain acyl-CoA ligase ACSF2, mitochondrial-like [Hyalella azteca]
MTVVNMMQQQLCRTRLLLSTGPLTLRSNDSVSLGRLNASCRAFSVACRSTIRPLHQPSGAPEWSKNTYSGCSFTCVPKNKSFCTTSVFSPSKKKYGVFSAGALRKYSHQASSSVHPQRFLEPLEWSYASMPGEEPLLGLTMGQVLARAGQKFQGREAVVSVAQDIRVTYEQLQRDSLEMAAGLVGLGLEAGDRVGIWSGNNYEWVVTQWAVGIAGLVLVNINPSYVASELLYCLKKVDVKALVMSPTFKNVEGTLSFSELSCLATAEHRELLSQRAAEVQFDAPCSIQFTSGTTGNPKAAVLSHHNVVNNAYGIGYRSGYHLKEYVICVPVPLYHCFGCVAGTLTGALFGATLVLPSPAFSARAAFDVLTSEPVTSCYGTPTMYVDILAAARRAAEEGGTRTVVPSLMTGLMAGAPCPPELVQAVITELGMKDFMVMYGLTETSPVCFQCSPNDPQATRSQTVGYPSSHLEVKVVDGDGRVVRVGEEGELCVRGYSVFLGYWGDPVKTEEVISQDRWFKTGDLAAMDSSGYAFIRGRKKDMIIRGGENIYPAELENIFMAHPFVLEAQVFGIPDPRLGEVVVAWLRLQEGRHLTQEEFQAWCRDRVAPFKVPAVVMMRKQFPVTVTGKIQKFKMRDETIELLKAQ